MMVPAGCNLVTGLLAASLLRQGCPAQQEACVAGSTTISGTHHLQPGLSDPQLLMDIIRSGHFNFSVEVQHDGSGEAHRMTCCTAAMSSGMGRHPCHAMP